MAGLVGSLWSADVVDHSWHYWCNFHFPWFKWKKGRLNKWTTFTHTTHQNKHIDIRHILRHYTDTTAKIGWSQANSYWLDNMLSCSFKWSQDFFLFTKFSCNLWYIGLFPFLLPSTVMFWYPGPAKKSDPFTLDKWASPYRTETFSLKPSI